MRMPVFFFCDLQPYVSVRRLDERERGREGEKEARETEQHLNETRIQLHYNYREQTN